MKSRLTYNLGPLRNAKPVIAKMHAIEKQVVNLAGATTIAPSSRRERNMNTPEAAKKIAPHMKLFSLLIKLKTDSHPSGSGSLRPMTKSLADVKPPLMALPADSRAD